MNRPSIELSVLETHRDNLANAKTFEEYRDHHVAFVDMLIKQEKAKTAFADSCEDFIMRLAMAEKKDG